MQSYTWKITDATLLKQMKSAANGNGFNNPTFTLFNLRWYLDFYPNGEAESSKGCCNLFLKLVMLPKKVSEIVLRRKLTNQESGRFSEIQTSFKEGDTSTGWCDSKLKTNKIQKK
eukprot:50102_1